MPDSRTPHPPLHPGSVVSIADAVWLRLRTEAAEIVRRERNVTVAGVPAKVIGEAGCAEPSRTMHQLLSDAGSA